MNNQSIWATAQNGSPIGYNIHQKIKFHIIVNFLKILQISAILNFWAVI